MPDPQTQYPHLPPDDLSRTLTSTNPDHEGKLPHIGLVGDTYTITVDGGDTNGRFCVVDMHIPAGGGPGPHRHDFEETFIVLDGEIEATSVPQRIRKPGSSDLYLFSRWAGEILPGSWRPCSDPHHSSSQTR